MVGEYILIQNGDWESNMWGATRYILYAQSGRPGG